MNCVRNVTPDSVRFRKKARGSRLCLLVPRRGVLETEIEESRCQRCTYR
jgi:hypothetical protein